ncbi:unconventional prefoldin RPB5 interactor-like protein [Uranotaenia lowii]|uniref:unconventional prefoldin RPB5 interactor-like protein n=1 Tax=Uranotaenia lowii TaxID=190385 RepID=UPI00247A6D3F|nr:unconventional prefoldin RPB5 interactor-like protein [Uranotaenia lowii]
MDGFSLYNKAYSEALETNKQESERWTNYRKEHADLRTNLEMYQQLTKVDVLIPLGSKAFIPGQLYHTGELFASHGCGYFSHCSVKQANQIIEHRIRKADEMICKFQQEKDLFANKLELPFHEEAFGGQEIIEEYNEEHEKLWQEQHRKNVREEKMREAKERANGKTDNQDIVDRLEELELLEELENEMNNIDVPIENDDQLRQLMSGQIKTNHKKRNAHIPRNSHNTSEVVESKSEELKLKKNENEEECDEEQYEVEITDDDDNEDSGSNSSQEDVSAEFLKLLQDTKTFNKAEKTRAFEEKLRDIRKRLDQPNITINEKVDLCDLKYDIEEALDFLSPNWEDESAQYEAPAKVKKSKSITFAESDSVKIIDSNEAVYRRAEDPSSKTLKLKIEHSSGAEPIPISKGDEISSPVDIYRLFAVESNDSGTDKKSILKNREKVLAETHFDTLPMLNSSRRKRESLPVNIIGDVVERDTNVSNEEKFNSAKKVSRFKQQRS